MTTVLAFTQPPSSVTDPVYKLLAWMMFAVGIVCMTRLSILGVEAFTAHQRGEEFAVMTAVKLGGLAFIGAASLIATFIIPN